MTEAVRFVWCFASRCLGEELGVAGLSRLLHRQDPSPRLLLQGLRLELLLEHLCRLLLEDLARVAEGGLQHLLVDRLWNLELLRLLGEYR